MTDQVTRLLLWRHGQTAWNAARRFQGQTDVPLDETGLAQAARAAERLAAADPAVIVSSDLSRASATAAALASVTGLPVSYDVRLRERAYGGWQGLTGAEVEQRWPDVYAHWRAGGVVEDFGIEKIDDVAKRVHEALLELVERHPRATVVVATHGGAAKRGIGAVLGWPQQVVASLGELRNCHTSELRHHHSRGWQLFAHNVG